MTNQLNIEEQFRALHPNRELTGMEIRILDTMSKSRELHIADVNWRGLQNWKSVDEAFYSLSKRLTDGLSVLGVPNVVIQYSNILCQHTNPIGEFGTWKIVVGGH